MISYKVRQSTLSTKAGKRLFYPIAISTGQVTTTLQIARELSIASGATTGDVIGMLRDLGAMMRERLKDGHRVVLDGIGSFRISASARGNGVEKADAVNAGQFNRLAVLFTPESTANRALGVREVTLISGEVRFVPFAKKNGGDPIKPGTGGETPGTGGETPGAGGI